MRRLLLLLLLPLVLPAPGCVRLGPEYSRPPLATPARFQHAATTAAYLERDKWWLDFGDRRLDELVQEALAHNLELKKAAARVLELKARFSEAGSYLYPSLGLEAQAKRQQSLDLSANLPPSLRSERRTETYNLSLAAGYEVDLWGKLSLGAQAAWQELLAARENRRTVAQTLVAQVVSAYLNQQALERRLALSSQSIQAVETSLAVVESRYRHGLTSVLDLTQARRTLAQARALKPSLRLELARVQQKLALLLGRYPRTGPARSQPVDYFPHLRPVPPGLPSGLLERRPDLRAAEARLRALNARVGQALAARFPSLKLTGAFGYSSRALGALFNPAGELWNLAAGLTQPIFDAGRLESRQEAAQARLEQGKAAYAQAVLNAFKEVEEALVTRRELMERHRLLGRALADAVATQDTASERYQRGLTDYLRVLEAMRVRYEIEDSLILLELAILTNRVSLYRALGGGWDHLPPAGKGKP